MRPNCLLLFNGDNEYEIEVFILSKELIHEVKFFTLLFQFNKYNKVYFERVFCMKRFGEET